MSFSPPQSMFQNGGLFGASQGLAAPLPPDYLSAAQGMNFALFRWWCPFNLITNPAFTGASPGQNLTATSDAFPSPAGRRLLSRDIHPFARVLCAPAIARHVAEENAALLEARVRAHVPFWTGAGPAVRRRLLAENGTANVTVVAVPAKTNGTANGTNGTSTELPTAAYGMLVSAGLDPEGFLTDTISNQADNG